MYCMTRLDGDDEIKNEKHVQLEQGSRMATDSTISSPIPVSDMILHVAHQYNYSTAPR
jgi:hypothetical protein